MHVTFRQLRTFLALADTGSVSAAARATHVTQPTASAQLRELAQAVGLPLYDIVSRKVRLTEAGEALARTARAIGHEWAAFEQHVDGLKGLERGRLRVAVVSTAKYFVPRLLGDFCAAHPGIDITLQVLNRDGVVARLRDNLDDLYVMSTPPQDLELEDRVFLPNPLVVIAPADSTLRRRRRLALPALAGQRILLREPGSGTRMAVDAHFARQRFRPERTLELGSNEAIREAVAGGLGVAVLSRHALTPLQDPRGVVELDVEGFPLPSQWHVVHRAGRRLSPIAEVFRAHLMAHAAEDRPAVAGRPPTSRASRASAAPGRRAPSAPKRR